MRNDMRATRHDQQAWWAAYQDMVPPGYMEYIREESEATGILCFQAAVMPGLFQTEAYARGVIRQFRDVLLSEEEFEQRVALRLKRQWEVLEKEQPPRIHAVIEESVLRRIVGNNEVQYEQLLHLIELSKLPNVTIQILPLSDGVVWSIFGHCPVDILLFTPPRKTALFIDGYHDYHKSTSTFEITHYRTMFKSLSERALSPERSVDFIQDIAKTILHAG